MQQQRGLTEELFWSPFCVCGVQFWIRIPLSYRLGTGAPKLAQGGPGLQHNEEVSLDDDSGVSPWEVRRRLSTKASLPIAGSTCSHFVGDFQIAFVGMERTARQV